MRPSFMRLAALAIGLALVSAPAVASARTKVEWSRVDMPEGADAARREKLLRAALIAAAKRANFGTAKAVTLSARVTEFTVDRRGEILRISCTILGRVHGGASAKSRISFGGNADAPGELEKQVITMVANGVVARLAQIARTQAPKPAPDG